MEHKTAKVLYYTLFLVLAICPSLPHPLTQCLLIILSILGAILQHVFRSYLTSRPICQQTVLNTMYQLMSYVLEFSCVFTLVVVMFVATLGKAGAEQALNHNPLLACVLFNRDSDMDLAFHYCGLIMALDYLGRAFAPALYMSLDHDLATCIVKGMLGVLVVVNFLARILTGHFCSAERIKYFTTALGLNIKPPAFKDDIEFVNKVYFGGFVFYIVSVLCYSIKVKHAASNIKDKLQQWYLWPRKSKTITEYPEY